MSQDQLSVVFHRESAAAAPAASRMTARRLDSAAYRRAGKRAFDIAFSAALLVMLVIVFTVIALAIKLDSRGPVFYRVRRMGYRGRPFLMLKFRKMHDDARGGPLTVAADPRLTRVGRVLTSTRLDELPQLWDVLCGRMSIIGPRPEDPAFVELHDDEYEEILMVRPGISGLSQIAYKEEAAIVDSVSPVEDYITRIMPQKLTLDTLYARTVSLRLDVRIVYWTFVTVVLRHAVSVNRATAAMTIRRRRPAPQLPVSAPVAPPEIELGGAAPRADVAVASYAD